MLSKDRLQFLQNLLTTPSPVGFETAGQKVWLDYIDEYADETFSDTYGSAFAKIQVDKKAPTVMLEAHCDEIGMMVQYIDDKGFVYITKLGGSDPTIARAKKIRIHSRKGTVTGVVGNTAIHLQDKENNKAPAWKDLYVDIGATNKEEALQMVQVGDPITFADDFEFLTDELITGRALDNRIGGFMIANAFRKLSARKDKLRVNVVALNAVQEEIGGFGARMMTYRLMPDLALVTDVTHATDTPGINVKEHGEVKLGGGPSVTHGAASHPKVVERVVQVAEEKEIPLQHEAASVRTGTDTDSIFYQQKGVASGLISLPLRYMHSPVETASITDIDLLTDLMAEVVLSVSSKDSFTAI